VSVIIQLIDNLYGANSQPVTELFYCVSRARKADIVSKRFLCQIHDPGAVNNTINPYLCLNAF